MFTNNPYFRNHPFFRNKLSEVSGHNTLRNHLSEVSGHNIRKKLNEENKWKVIKASTFSGASSYSRQQLSYTSPYSMVLRMNGIPILSHTILNKLKSPFLEYPRKLIDSTSFLATHNSRMGLGFRFFPGLLDYLYHDVQLPDSFDSLTQLKNSIGLSKRNHCFSTELLHNLSHSGAGLRSLFNYEDSSKILVEVVSFFKGWYWRIFVLVNLGVGCTVWYSCAPGIEATQLIAPFLNPYNLFAPIEPFFNIDHVLPGFIKYCFVESKDVIPTVQSAFENEAPFSEIPIPVSGDALKTAVGLGVMVAILLAVGLVPNVENLTT